MDDTLLIFFNQTLANPILDAIMVIITYAGLALLPAIGVLLIVAKQRRAGLAVLAALLVGEVFTLAFQFLALRPRPVDVRAVIPTPNFPSFPSGHAAAAFAVAAVLMLSYRRWRVWLPTLIGAGLIAFSRVYLGVHYFSDILGGAVVGLGAGAACYGLFALNRPDWRWLLWIQVAVVIVISEMAYLSILPDASLLKAPMDKILHFVLFGAVTFWLNLWLGRSAKIKFVPLAVLIPFLIAVLEEGAQFFSPVRTADFADLFSDLSGMLFFWWMSEQALKLRIKEKPAPQSQSTT
ncbi:MAG: VanZ family protein [Chloroflexi bacterium]|nr:VanZ family protein [Chloroflexota bacterium]